MRNLDEVILNIDIFLKRTIILKNLQEKTER